MHAAVLPSLSPLVMVMMTVSPTQMLSAPPPPPSSHMTRPVASSLAATPPPPTVTTAPPSSHPATVIAEARRLEATERLELSRHSLLLLLLLGEPVEKGSI